MGLTTYGKGFIQYCQSQFSVPDIGTYINTYNMEIRILNRYTISLLNVIQSLVLRCMLIYFQNININMCGKWRLVNRIWGCFVMYDLYALIVTTTCIKTYLYFKPYELGIKPVYE